VSLSPVVGSLWVAAGSGRLAGGRQAPVLTGVEGIRQSPRDETRSRGRVWRRTSSGARGCARRTPRDCTSPAALVSSRGDCRMRGSPWAEWASARSVGPRDFVTWGLPNRPEEGRWGRRRLVLAPLRHKAEPRGAASNRAAPPSCRGETSERYIPTGETFAHPKNCLEHPPLWRQTDRGFSK